MKALLLACAATLAACGGRVSAVPSDDAAVDASIDVDPADTAVDVEPSDTAWRDTWMPDTTVPDVPPDAPPGATTGSACKDHGDCDVTGEGIAYCTNRLYVVGPLHPTPVCMQIDSSGEDVCTPSDDAAVRFCDGSTGVCVKEGSSGGGARCEPMCILDGSGAFIRNCTGLNACNPRWFRSVGSAPFAAVGTCQGGCTADADCPTGSKCDPLFKLCFRSCTSDTQCKSGWPSAPSLWRCDATRGACSFFYAKKVGDACSSAASSADECQCLTGGSGTGLCTSFCKTGAPSPCPSGFTCDARLPVVDAAGKTVFKLTTQPSGLGGHCLKNCSSASDCPSGFACEASAGLTQKTCRPKP